MKLVEMRKELVELQVEIHQDSTEDLNESNVKDNPINIDNYGRPPVNQKVTYKTLSGGFFHCC